MKWPETLDRAADAIQADDDAVAILGPAETQALYYEGTRAYRVPSLDFFLVAATRGEVTETALVQFNGHGESIDDCITIGQMLERRFDQDVYYTLGDIYLRSSKVEDGPLSGPDKHGVFHQSWDYEFEVVRSKYGRYVVSES